MKNPETKSGTYKPDDLTVSDLRTSTSEDAQWIQDVIVAGAQAATEAYLSLLAVPHDCAFRIAIQPALCQLRDFLALATHRTSEDIQNSFEAIAAKASAVGDRTASATRSAGA